MGHPLCRLALEASRTVHPTSSLFPS
jgi:hypothetical protein